MVLLDCLDSNHFILSVPALFGGGLAIAGCLAGIVMHLVASLRLSSNVKGCWLPAMLFMGGWLLMAIVGFLGCAMNVPY